MRLSPHFTLAEMTATQHPALQDEPSLEAVVNLTRLCCLVLEPLREKLGGKPLRTSSGYRSEQLNKAVGGVSTSRHLTGRAADIPCTDSGSAGTVARLLRENPNVQKAITEHNSRGWWVHVQW